MSRRTMSIMGLVFVASGLPALGVEGRIPIFGPTTISEPGSYILTQDFSVASGDSIIIAANDVTLDLNGHTITHAATAGSNVMVPAGVTRVRLHNGRLIGGSYGIRATSEFVPDGVVIAIDHVAISDTMSQGIWISDARIVDVISCQLQNIGGDGIAVSTNGFAVTAFTGRFNDNVLEGVGGDGLHFFGCNKLEVKGNSITVDRGWGITLAGGCGYSHVQGNSVAMTGTAAQGDLGIYLQPGSYHNLVLDNIVRGFFDSIYVYSDGNRVAGNVLQGARNGIGVWGRRNLIEGNQSDGNGGCGINFEGPAGAANAYRSNMLRGNTGGAVCGLANTDAGGNIF